jgi:DHA1 family tetracycline resistance protein-like MFS transporter
MSAAWGPRIPYVIAAAAAAATVLLTWITLDETLSPEQRAANRRFAKAEVDRGALLRRRGLVLILVIVFVAQFGLGLLQATFALYGQAVLFAGRSAAAVSTGIGLLLATVGLGQLVTQVFLLRRALAVAGEQRLVVVGICLRTTMFIALAVTTSPWIAAMGTIAFAVAQGLMMPSLQSLATVTAPDEERGAVLGLYQSAASLSIIFSTAIAGVLFAIDPTVPYWLAAALGLVVLVPALALVRGTPEAAAPPVSK